MCTATLMLGSSLVAKPPLKEGRQVTLYLIPVFIVNLIQERCQLICPKAKSKQGLASGVAQSTNRQSPFKKRCSCPHGLSLWSSPTRLQHISCPLKSWIGSCVIAVSVVVCWDHKSCWEEALKLKWSNSLAVTIQILGILLACIAAQCTERGSGLEAWCQVWLPKSYRECLEVALVQQ